MWTNRVAPDAFVRDRIMRAKRRVQRMRVAPNIDSISDFTPLGGAGSVMERGARRPQSPRTNASANLARSPESLKLGKVHAKTVCGGGHSAEIF